MPSLYPSPWHRNPQPLAFGMTQLNAEMPTPFPPTSPGDPLPPDAPVSPQAPPSVPEAPTLPNEPGR